MSLQAHKGQILPLANQLIPISQNTTFHASYDNDLNGFNQMQKVSPFGYQQSLYFDGLTTYITANGVSNLVASTTALTIEGWFKPATNGSVGAVAIGFHTSSGGNLNLINYLHSTNKFAYYDEVLSTRSSTTTITVGTWNHVAVTIDSSNNLCLYVNGNLEVSGLTTTARPASGGRFTIGQDWDSSTPTDFFKGNVSDVRVWNYARTAQQIKDSMHAELRGIESGLMAYYKLNKGEGIIVDDSSIYGNDGLLVGSLLWAEGRTVATLRPDGKFTGAVAVEEATTNLVLTPFLDIDSDLDGVPDNWTKTFGTGGAGYSVSLTTKTDTLVPGQSCVMINNVSATNPRIYQYITVLPSTTYTCKARWACDTVNATFKIGDGSSSSNTTHLNLQSSGTGRFEESIYTFTTGVAQTSVNLTFFVSAASTTIIWVDAVQLEQKSFATSYVSGSRSVSNLAYPNSLLQGATQGTISFWYKPSNIGGSYEALARSTRWAAGYPGWGILKNSGSNAVYFEYGVPGGGTVISAAANNALTVNQWHLIVARWNTTGVSMYVFKEDGTVVSGSTTATTPTVTYVDPIQFGTTPVVPALQVNALYSEIRIDRVYASDDEITSWYYANAPFYNYLDYSGEAY